MVHPSESKSRIFNQFASCCPVDHEGQHDDDDDHNHAQKPDACLAVVMTPEMGYERPDGTTGAAGPRRHASTKSPMNAAKGRMSCFTLADSRALM